MADHLLEPCTPAKEAQLQKLYKYNKNKIINFKQDGIETLVDTSTTKLLLKTLVLEWIPALM